MPAYSPYPSLSSRPAATPGGIGIDLSGAKALS
jgi:hypothetical protein